MDLSLIGLATAPVLAVLIFIYFKDKYDREPLWMLLVTFAMGMFSVIPALLLETLANNIGMGISDSNVLKTLEFAVIGIGFSEEFSKYIFLVFFAFRSKHFNESFDGIVYAVMVSMGFAFVENLLYVMQGGLEVGLLRAVTAVPAHACFAIIMGYYVGKAKFVKGGTGFILLLAGLIAATIVHGLYDFFLFQNNIKGFWLFTILGIFPLSVVFSFIAIKQRQKESPFRKKS